MSRRGQIIVPGFDRGFQERLQRQRAVAGVQMFKQAALNASKAFEGLQQTVSELPLRKRVPIAWQVLLGRWGRKASTEAPKTAMEAPE